MSPETLRGDLVLDLRRFVPLQCIECGSHGLENNELIHEAPAIVGRQTPSALAHAASQ